MSYWPYWRIIKSKILTRRSKRSRKQINTVKNCQQPHGHFRFVCNHCVCCWSLWKSGRRRSSLQTTYVFYWRVKSRSAPRVTGTVVRRALGQRESIYTARWLTVDRTMTMASAVQTFLDRSKTNPPSRSCDGSLKSPVVLRATEAEKRAIMNASEHEDYRELVSPIGREASARRHLHHPFLASWTLSRVFFTPCVHRAKPATDVKLRPFVDNSRVDYITW